MFKVKLIDDRNYYKLRSKQLLFFFLLVIPTGIIANLYQVSFWLFILIIGLYILMIVFFSRNQKRLIAGLGNKYVEIDENEIRVILKNGTQVESITLEKVEKIILKEDYSMPLETMKDIGKEMTGNPKENYLIFQLENKKRKIYFEFDSFYMLEELKKIIKSWEIKGYNIERVEKA